MESPRVPGEPLSLCTIGDLILDVVVLPERPPVPDADTPATIRLAAGGQAANVAAWASALGASSRLICKRGDDAASEFATAELARHGVEIRGPVARGRGGVVVSTRDPGGGRTMASDRGVAPLLEPSELDPSWVRSCDVLHVSGYCLLREPMAEAAIEAARLASRVTGRPGVGPRHRDPGCPAVRGAPASARSRSRVRHRDRAGRGTRLRRDVGDQARPARRDVPGGALPGPVGRRARHDGRGRCARGRLPGGRAAVRDRGRGAVRRADRRHARPHDGLR